VERSGAAEVRAIQGQVDAQRARQTPRPGGHQARGGAAGIHGVDPFDRLERPDEHRRGIADRPGHDVQAAVHAVHEIDVRMPRFAEHHLRARRPPPGGVARQVARAVVRLDLDDAPREPRRRAVPVRDRPHDDRPEEIARDLVDRPGVERAGQRRER